MTLPSDPPVNVVHFGGVDGSIYGILFPGGLDRAKLVLGLIGGFQNLGQVGRCRDGWIERDPEHEFVARIVTRNGGSNRAEYTEAIERMRAHPGYLRDSDDPGDTTYASFYFTVPNPDASDLLEQVAKDHVVMDRTYWDNALDAHIQLLKDPAQARHPSVVASKTLMDQLAAQLGE